MPKCVFLKTIPHPYSACKAGCLHFRRSCSDENGEVCITVFWFVLKQSMKQFPTLLDSTTMEINGGAVGCNILQRAGKQGPPQMFVLLATRVGPLVQHQ